MEIVEYKFKLKEKSKDYIREWSKDIPKDNVVLFRDQDLSKQDLVNVYKNIGRTYPPRKKEFFCDEEFPELFRVTNIRVNGEKTGVFADKELDWHSNGNARDQGKECCIALYCVYEGEDSVTSFCDTRQAYLDLPQDVKEEVDSIECLYGFKNGTFYDLEEDDKELEMFRNRGIYLNGIKRPLVYTHPYDKQRGLYYTFHYIREVYNNKTEWKELDKYLRNHVFQEKYVTSHSWQPGDLIFMDQYHSLHKRNEVKGKRLLYRTALDYKHAYRN